MKALHLILAAGTVLTVAAQSSSEAVIVNIETAKWTREKGAEPGSEGVMLHADKNGGIDLLVRFPAGHVIPPHFHDSNERIFVAEGELILHRESGGAVLKPGGFAWLPAREGQRLSCASAGRCTFYLSWDGKPDSHPVK
jgi:quercetin dioxygenase-like cupin family protein